MPSDPRPSLRTEPNVNKIETRWRTYGVRRNIRYKRRAFNGNTVQSKCIHAEHTGHLSFYTTPDDHLSSSMQDVKIGLKFHSVASRKFVASISTTSEFLGRFRRTPLPRKYLRGKQSREARSTPTTSLRADFPYARNAYVDPGEEQTHTHTAFIDRSPPSCT